MVGASPTRCSLSFFVRFQMVVSRMGQSVTTAEDGRTLACTTRLVAPCVQLIPLSAATRSGSGSVRRTCTSLRRVDSTRRRGRLASRRIIGGACARAAPGRDIPTSFRNKTSDCCLPLPTVGVSNADQPTVSSMTTSFRSHSAVTAPWTTARCSAPRAIATRHYRKARRSGRGVAPCS